MVEIKGSVCLLRNWKPILFYFIIQVQNDDFALLFSVYDLELIIDIYHGICV